MPGLASAMKPIIAIFSTLNCKFATSSIILTDTRPKQTIKAHRFPTSLQRIRLPLSRPPSTLHFQPSRNPRH